MDRLYRQVNRKVIDRYVHIRLINIDNEIEIGIDNRQLTYGYTITKKQRNRETEKQRNGETEKQRNRETEKQRYRETEKQRKKDGQIDYILNRNCIYCFF